MVRVLVVPWRIKLSRNRLQIIWTLSHCFGQLSCCCRWCCRCSFGDYGGGRGGSGGGGGGGSSGASGASGAAAVG